MDNLKIFPGIIQKNSNVALPAESKIKHDEGEVVGAGNDEYRKTDESNMPDDNKLEKMIALLNNGEGNKILVSSCLAGINCRYDCSNCKNESLKKLVDEGKAITVCPEQLGGLPTPRTPSEISGGDGTDVLNGKASVVTKNGEDFTRYFVTGADIAMQMATGARVIMAVLKSKSPSCGVGKIYDGSFTGNLKEGNGITAAMLRRAGIDVISDVKWNELNKSAS